VKFYNETLLAFLENSRTSTRNVGGTKQDGSNRETISNLSPPMTLQNFCCGRVSLSSQKKN